MQTNEKQIFAGVMGLRVKIETVANVSSWDLEDTPQCSNQNHWQPTGSFHAFYCQVLFIPYCLL